MNNEYPKMLYADNGNVKIDKGFYATLIVNDEDEFDAAIEAGWRTHWVEEHKTFTKDELRALYQEQFGEEPDGRWSEETLLEKLTDADKA